MNTEPSVTRGDVASGLRALGVDAGARVLVHSSLKSFGHVDGGADAVIGGVLDAVGESGTLLVPTLTGHPDLSPENPPHVDLRTAACWTGRIPETLRQRAGAVRSVHPTHSCAAIGADAAALTANHEASPTPCGPTSPYQRLARAGGMIVHMGCGLGVCTTFHAIESLACLEYHLQKRIAFGSCIDSQGRRVETPCRLHDYGSPEREFPVMEPVLVKKGIMRTGRIGRCMVRVIDAGALVETTLALLRHDPWYLTVYRGRKDIFPWA